MEIMKIVQDQISSHGTTAAVKLKSVCEELEIALHKVLDEVKKWRDVPRGFRGQLKEIVKSNSIAEKISESQNKVRALCSNLKLVAAIDTNFEVHKINAALTAIAPNLSVTQATQSINNCPPPSRIFHGRQAILAKMHQDFTQDLTEQQIYVLYGLGGSGKTQIALKFIRESASRTLGTIESGLKSIAVTKQIGNTAKDALYWLQSKPNEWLLFFDNADDPKIDLHSFFPRCNHGNILITSRNPQLRGYGSYSHVSDMEETEAVELLLRSAAQEITPTNQSIAAEIVKALWYLPLAIVQAGAFILKSGSLNSYLALYTKNKEQLLREKPAQSHDDYAWTVYTTWQISFDQLSKPAAMLLQLFSFLHHDGISEKFFNHASLYRFPTSGPTKEELQMPLEFLSQFLGPDNTWNSLSFFHVTNELQAYSLINFNADRNVFSIHPLVHAWSQKTLQSGIISFFLSLLPHISALLHGDLLVTPDFNAEYGKIFYDAGKYREAQKLLVRTVEKQRKLDSDEDARTLLAMKALGVTYQRLGQFNDAKELLIVVFNKQKQVLGDDHIHTLVTMNHLAWSYNCLGQLKDAVELQIVVLEKLRQLFGEDHPKTLHGMNHLACIYDSLGRYKKAEAIQIVVLEKRRKINGDADPRTLTAMCNLALIYRGFKKVEDLQVSLFEKEKKIMGADSLSTLNNSPSMSGDLGHYKEAGELQTQLLGQKQKILGDVHLSTQHGMSDLGFTFRCLSRDEDAEKLQIVVLEKRKKIFGTDHPETLRAMDHLAMTYHSMSRFKEAEELQSLALKKRKDILGEDHPDTMFSLNNLGLIYHGLGRLQEASELLTGVLEKLRKLRGADHPRTLLSMNNLAWVYQSLHKFPEAEKLQSVVLEKRKKVLGNDHPDTLRTMTHLAKTLHNLNRFEEAQELQIMVLEKQKNLLGEDTHTLLSTSNQAFTHLSGGQFQDAEELQNKQRTTLVCHHQLAQLTKPEELQVMEVREREA
ncbi:hypothetical protein FB451DRAFT_1365069 [Mycena latifolia]|nr:hypothetical protein FB451DRAFT_1365069 [Mycena latifolia]